MMRSFVFGHGKLLAQDPSLDFLHVMVRDEDVHVWMDIDDAPDDEVKTLLEGVFSFHPLAIEDCIAPSDLPKIDEYESCVFMVIHGVDYSQEAHGFQTNELNMFIGKNFLVTVHRRPLRCVAQTIDRVLKNAPAVAKAPDRLTYTVLDFLLENYGPALQNLSSEIAELEKNAFTVSASDVLSRVLQLKAEVQRLRQIVWPQRDVLARLARGEFKIVRAHMLPYYRDLLNHLVRISDLAESYRDSLTNTLQVYLGIQQNQINQVIKFLTVVATLALPIVVVTSFYGMNFRMPELQWEFPMFYLWVFGLTALSTVSLYIYLRRRGT